VISKITTTFAKPGSSSPAKSRLAGASYDRQALADTGKDGSSSDDQADHPSNGDSLLAAVNTVSTYVQSTSREVHLYVDSSSGGQQISVVDSATGQTIRNIPANEVMALSRHISSKSSDPIKGLLVKSQA